MNLLIKAAVAASALYLMSPSANASMDTFGVHVGSVHSNKNSNWNNSNPGVYAVWGVHDLSTFADGNYVAGTYYNSIRKQSFYVGRLFEWGNVGLIAGVVTGYSRPALPMVVPTVRLDLTPHWKARITVVPKVDKNGAAAVHFSFEYKF